MIFFCAKEFKKANSCIFGKGWHRPSLAPHQNFGKKPLFASALFKSCFNDLLLFRRPNTWPFRVLSSLSSLFLLLVLISACEKWAFEAPSPPQYKREAWAGLARSICIRTIPPQFFLLPPPPLDITHAPPHILPKGCCQRCHKALFTLYSMSSNNFCFLHLITFGEWCLLLKEY